MQTVIIGWTLPTTRESGRPLPPEEIRHVRIELSADGGANYVLLGDFAPTELQTTLPDLDFGEYLVRGLVADTKGRVSQPGFGTFEIVPPVDETPPGPVTITITFA